MLEEPVQMILKEPVQMPLEEGLQMPLEVPLHMPQEETIQIPEEETLQLPEEDTLQMPEGEKFQVPLQERLRMPQEDLIQLPLITASVGSFVATSLSNAFVTSPLSTPIPTIEPEADPEEENTVVISIDDLATILKSSLTVTPQQPTATTTIAQKSASPPLVASQPIITSSSATINRPDVFWGLGGDAFCDLFLEHIDDFPLLGEDPIVIAYLNESFPKGTGARLVAMSNEFDNMYNQARRLLSKIEDWRFRDVLGGISRYELALNHAQAQKRVDSSVRRLLKNYKTFMDSALSDAILVEWHIRRKAAKYNSENYDEANIPRPWFPALFPLSPLGEIKGTLKEFASAQFNRTREMLVTPTVNVLRDLNLAQAGLGPLLDKFKVEWQEWAHECAEGVNYHTLEDVPATVSSHTHNCSDAAFEYARNFLQHDFEATYTNAAADGHALVYSSKALMCQYMTMANSDPRRITNMEEDQFETYEGFQQGVSDLREKIVAAIDRFSEHGDVEK